jgi:hypothetical protein
MAECGTCDRWFGSERAARQHMDAVGHTWECDFCQDEYYYEQDLEDHQDEEKHYGPRYECEGCYVFYDDYQQLKRHMYKEDHWRDNWCGACQKGFESESHLRTVKHSTRSDDRSRLTL